MYQNVINALNEFLLHSGNQTWFTHWGINKARGISIKMKVKGKLHLNINLYQQCIYVLNPSFVIKRERLGNMQRRRRVRGNNPAQKDECYLGVRVRRLVWNNNFLCHIMLVRF